MDHIETGHLNNDFRTTLHRLMESGLTAHPRGTTTKEHLNYNISLFDPRNRIVNFADRKTSLKYLLGEFIWYCTGSDNPEGILPYAKFWDGIRNSGDEIGYERGTINSNYGTRLFGHSSLPAFTKRTDSYDGVEAIDQWQSTIDMLKADKDSRQAIMNIHVPSDRHAGNKDVPCTLTLHWFIREDKLHLIVNMRSNDVILGFTNDVFQFTMLQEAMCVSLRETYPQLELGAYYHNAGSMHIYDRHFAMADKIIADTGSLELSMVPMDVFNQETVLNLKHIADAWVKDGMKLDFPFKDWEAFKSLSPYWQHLVLMCFAEDPEAMHGVFGIQEQPDYVHG